MKVQYLGGAAALPYLGVGRSVEAERQVSRGIAHSGAGARSGISGPTSGRSGSSALPGAEERLKPKGKCHAEKKLCEPAKSNRTREMRKKKKFKQSPPSPGGLKVTRLQVVNL
jgi:hypothetical protein